MATEQTHGAHVVAWSITWTVIVVLVWASIFDLRHSIAPVHAQPKAEAEDHAQFLWGDELTNAHEVRTVWKIRVDQECYLWFESSKRERYNIPGSVSMFVQPITCR